VRRSLSFLIYAALFLVLVHALTACSLAKKTQPAPTSPPVTLIPSDTPGELPDLAVAEIALQNAATAGPADDCKPVSWPQQITVRVENRGGSPAGAFIVQINEFSQPVQAGLTAGQSTILLFSVNTGAVTVIVDPDSQVTESNETNNHASKVFVLPTPSTACLPTPAAVIPSARPLKIMSGHSAEVLSIAFSPDGGLIASGSVDNTMRLWRVREEELLRTMRGHPFPVLTLDFSPTGSLLATGSTDSKLRIWRVSDGSLLRTLEGHAGRINSIDFSYDGLYLVSCAEDFTVRIWRVSDGRQIQTIDEGMAQVTSVAFAPESYVQEHSQAIAWTEEDGTVRLRSFNGDWLFTMKETSFSATSLAFSQDGKWLVAGYADGTMRVWNTSDGTQIQALKSHTQKITSIAFSPDGKWLASASQDTTLRLWQIIEGKIENIPAWILSGHTGPVNSASFSPNSSLLASGSNDGTICLWNIPPVTEPGD
jgi:WD40 repeat protein